MDTNLTRKMTPAELEQEFQYLTVGELKLLMPKFQSRLHRNVQAASKTSDYIMKITNRIIELEDE